MPGTHLVYSGFIKRLMKGDIGNMTQVPIKVALLYQDTLGNPYVFNPAHEDWSSVKQYETISPDYLSGGTIVTNLIISVEANSVIIDTTTVPKELTVLTGTASAVSAVIYADTGELDSEKLLISHIDFGAALTSESAPFKLNWDDGGILIAQVNS